MTKKLLQAEIKSLEEQLRMLKAALDIVTDESEKEKLNSFALMYGLWKGKGSFSEEEIKAAEYKFDSRKFA